MANRKGAAFRWSYVILPLLLFSFSIILSAYFYLKLPAEVATHFDLNGMPDRWLSREMTMVWVMAPQLLFVLMAFGTTWGITRIGFLSNSAAGSWVRPERILQFMGNAFALPQLVLCFAMLDIFSYNSYQRHIVPLWISIFIVVGLATVVMGILLALLILKARRQLTAPPDRTKE